MPSDEAADRRRDLVNRLDDVTLGPVAVRPFSVEVEGVQWCLVDQTEEYDGYPNAEIHPVDIQFTWPWDGAYST